MKRLSELIFKNTRATQAQASSASTANTTMASGAQKSVA